MASTWGWLVSDPGKTQERGQRVDIFHYHHVWDGYFRSNWDSAKSNFRDIMADPEDIAYVTVLREPLQHWLSYYYFYRQPENKVNDSNATTSHQYLCR